MRPERKSRKAFARAGHVAQRPPDVQQGDGSFPNRRVGAKTRKKRRKCRRKPAAFDVFDGSNACLLDPSLLQALTAPSLDRPKPWRSEPFRPAAVVAIPALPMIPVSVEASLHPAVPPALAAKTAVATGKDREPALLGVVERLVERV